MRFDEVPAAVGAELGPTDWVALTPAQVADYVAATGDPGDTGRGLEPGPDAGDAVPPLLLLALTNLFMPELFLVDDASAGVNYGTAEVRFPAPAPVGSRLRATAHLVVADEIRGGLQTMVGIIVEAEGVADPVCTVDAISRWLH